MASRKSRAKAAKRPAHRPAKDPALKRDKSVTVKFTQSEHDAIDAKRGTVPAAIYIRERALAQA